MAFKAQFVRRYCSFCPSSQSRDMAAIQLSRCMGDFLDAHTDGFLVL